MPTTDAEKARNIALAANDLQASLLRDDRHYSNRSMHRLLVLCNTVIDLIDDGDCMAQRESLMDELCCDEGGNPVRDEPRDADRFWRDSIHAINAGMAS